MKFIKKHKVGIIATIVVIIIAVLSYFALKSMFIIGNDTGKYGNRLDGIENVEIKNEQTDKLIKEMEEIKDIKSVKYNLQGRLVYLIVEVTNDTAVEVAKGYANKMLSYFDDDQKGFYDIQVFIKSDSEESAVYPIIGAKHKTSASFVWTENKKETK